MPLKNEIVKALEKNRGKFLSGEELAKIFGVSRAAVWKAVSQLKQEGYVIEAVPNRGYILSENCDLLSEEGIRSWLWKQYQTIPISLWKETDSTNREAKQAAASGAEHGALFVAERQRLGRGRRGRSFATLEGKCIYMSVLLRPDVAGSDLIYLTTAASVAVYRAVQKVTGFKTGIKWVNDIYLDGKKLCGILSEAVTNCESGEIDSVVVGIGINFNVHPENIPEELKDIVCALYNGNSAQVTRNCLIAEITSQLLSLCEELASRSFLSEYKENSIVIGSDIFILDGTSAKEARAVDIDENGGLVVKFPDGSVQVLHTGEVSIRKKQDGISYL